MDEVGSRVGREGGAKAIDVPEVEVGRPGDVIDVGFVGECAVKCNTQTLDLGGGGNRGVVDGE